MVRVRGISLLGDQFYLIALPWLVLSLTGNALAVALLCQLRVDAYLPQLALASSPAMFLGMISAMLYRRDHNTAKAGYSAHYG